jgi:glycosyltransferase involved in cell wall biosynthesis
MKIGIFSKFSMVGGSELRCIEIANTILKYTQHKPFILTRDNKFSKELKERLSNNSGLVIDCFKTPEVFYDMDVIIIVNTDSKDFTKSEYWTKNGVDLSRVKKIGYIFNFVISPAEHLYQIENMGVDVRIMTGNERFFNEIRNKEKHAKIVHLPRTIIESPINPESVYDFKTESDVIRIGQHSKPLGDKWNDDYREVINRINNEYDGKVVWDFMGCNSEMVERLKGINNVTCRPQFSLSVKAYLSKIDIFTFFPKWNRQECWARSVGEALMSGCPVLATDTDGGNRMQVVHGSNGYLCKNVDEFEEKIEYLIKNKEMIKKLGKNARLYALNGFSSELVINKMMRFLG